MGTRGWGTEIFQEGVRIPPMKLVEEGRLDQKVMSIILTNTRTPDIHENDVTSQIASVQVASDDILALFRKYGADSLLACFSELIAYSDKRTRDEIGGIPDGHSVPEVVVQECRARAEVHRGGRGVVYRYRV